MGCTIALHISFDCAGKFHTSAYLDGSVHTMVGFRVVCYAGTEER